MGGKWRKDFFLRVCRCLHIVNDYYVPWFDFLAHEVNPEEVCSIIGLCGSDAPGFLELSPAASVSVLFPPYDRENEDAVRMLPLSPAIRMTGQEERQRPIQSAAPIDPSQGAYTTMM